MFDWPLSSEHWHLLVPGTDVTIIKRTHDGEEVVRYPGRVVPTNASSTWVELEALWTAGTVIQGPITFESGDILREFFSWNNPFNAFAVYTPAHHLKGWYSNVTYPSWVESDENGLHLYWQDLWLDVVSDVAGNTVNLDDDDLVASGIAQQDAHFHQAILEARVAILGAISSRSGPFSPSNF